MRDIYVERRENLLRVAIKENNLLSECYIEEESLEPVQGEIYKGIVKRVVPGIKSAFIDIGYSKQAYMILGEDEKDLKQGDGIIVEVLKEQFGSKGAKVTSKISLAGRYCVLETSRNDISISRKIENLEFKKELEKVKEGDSPNNISPIIKYRLEDGVRCLWMGDIEADFLDNVKEEIDFGKVDILFAPHHGRKRGKIPEDILKEINPKLIIIGEAPSKYLNYYNNYNTITQNTSKEIVLECEERNVHIYVGNSNYSVDFLKNKNKNSFENYIGTLEV